MKKAFTLVEMMIVIIIIGILMAALLPKLQWAQQRARDVARKANLSTLNTALLMYFNDKGIYPTWSCVSDISSDLVPSYLSSIPRDPQAARVTSWTKSGGCTWWVYAYSSLTKNWAKQWGAVVIANVEAFGKIWNYVLSWATEFNSGEEEIGSKWQPWLNDGVCQNWVYQSGGKVICSSSVQKWAVKLNGNMVYVVFN